MAVRGVLFRYGTYHGRLVVSEDALPGLDGRAELRERLGTGQGQGLTIPFEHRTPVDGANLTREDVASRRTPRPSPSNRTGTVTQEPVRERRSYEASGNVVIVRYADDIVVGFEREADPSTRHSTLLCRAEPLAPSAWRFQDAMRERLAAFALSLHPNKTRLLEFGRCAAANRQRRGLGKPGTFAFLGLTFICSKSRQGRFLVPRKSRGGRMRATLRAVKDGLRRRMHQPIPLQGRWLMQVATGYFNDHAVPTNSRALKAFRAHVTDLSRRTLRRRSQKDVVTWERIARIAHDGLPRPRILHPWPNQRFVVKHPRWGRMRVSRAHGSVRGAPRNGRPYRD